MSPPPCQGGMASRCSRRAPEHADAGRPVELVAAEDVEVGAQRPHVDAEVRRPLRAVHQHRDAARPGQRDDRRRAASPCRARWRPASPPAASPAGRAAAPARPGRGRRRRRWAPAPPGPRVAAASSCQGTMLEWCSSVVTTISSPAATRCRPKVWATRLTASVAPRTKTTSRAVGVEEPGHRGPGPLEGPGGPLGEGVDAAVDVGVVPLVEAGDGVDDGARLLRGGGAVEVDQRLAVDLLVERREVGAPGGGVEGGPAGPAPVEVAVVTPPPPAGPRRAGATPPAPGPGPQRLAAGPAPPSRPRRRR